MSYHRIHLRGPWEFDWLGASPLPTPLPGSQIAGLMLDARRIRMPAEWRLVFGPVAGEARFTRRFQWPTEIEEDERAAMVFLGFGGRGAATLNDVPLGLLAGGAASFDITGRFRSSNLLVVELEFDPAENDSPGGLWAPVAIEIRRIESSD